MGKKNIDNEKVYIIKDEGECETLCWVVDIGDTKEENFEVAKKQYIEQVRTFRKGVPNDEIKGDLKIYEAVDITDKMWDEDGLKKM